MSRNISIDIAKGIAILLVIVGHSHCIGSLTFKIIYSFHMPLFFLFAGCFYKKREVSDSLKRDFRRLLVPYLILAIIGTSKFFITQTLIHGDWQVTVDNMLAIIWGSSTNHTSLYFGDIKSIGIIWFLPALYVCKNLYNVIYINRKRLKIEKDVMFSVVVCLFSYLCAVIDRRLMNLPFALLSGGGALIFFHIGFCLKEKDLSIWVKTVLASCWMLAVNYSYLLMGNNHYGVYILDVAGAVGATIMLMAISSKLGGYSKPMSKVLAWLGANSMVVYCMHYLVILVDPNTRFNVHDWYVWLVIDFSLILPLSYLCTKIPVTRNIFLIR